MIEKEIKEIVDKHRKIWNIPDGAYGDSLIEFAKMFYNLGIQDASDNAKTRMKRDHFANIDYLTIDKESIEKLKI